MLTRTFAALLAVSVTLAAAEDEDIYDWLDTHGVTTQRNEAIYRMVEPVVTKFLQDNPTFDRNDPAAMGPTLDLLASGIDVPEKAVVYLYIGWRMCDLGAVDCAWLYGRYPYLQIEVLKRLQHYDGKRLLAERVFEWCHLPEYKEWYLQLALFNPGSARTARAEVAFADMDTLEWVLRQVDVETVLWLPFPALQGTLLSQYLSLAKTTEDAAKAVETLNVLRRRTGAAAKKAFPPGRFTVNRQTNYLAMAERWLAPGGDFDVLVASMTPKSEQE